MNTRHGDGRTVQRVLVAVVGVLVTAGLVGAGAVVLPGVATTARLEGEVSDLVRPSEAGTPPVRVTLGNPHVPDDPDATRTAESMSMRAERIPRPGVGDVTVELSGDGVGLPRPGEGLATFQHLEVAVELPDYVLTRLTGLHVTRVASAEDTSLVGGDEHTAVATVSGSWPDGEGESGDVELLLAPTENGARLTPREPTHGFPALRLDSEVLPFDVPVTDVVVRSGTIRVSGEASYVTVDLSRLGSPL